MKLNDLVELIASETGISEPTVRETARSLQKDGLIQIGRPGRYGGSEMTARDAANLSLALIASGETREVKTAHHLARQYADMRPLFGMHGNEFLELDAPALACVRGMTFIELLEALITSPDLGGQVPEEDDLDYEVSIRHPGAGPRFKYSYFDGVYIEVFFPPEETFAWRARYNLTRMIDGEYFRILHRALFGGETPS